MPRVTFGGKINSPLVWNVHLFSCGTWETTSDCVRGKAGLQAVLRTCAQACLPPPVSTAVVSSMGYACHSASQESGSRFQDGLGCCPHSFAKMGRTERMHSLRLGEAWCCLAYTKVTERKRAQKGRCNALERSFWITAFSSL